MGRRPNSVQNDNYIVVGLGKLILDDSDLSQYNHLKSLPEEGDTILVRARYQKASSSCYSLTA